MAATRWATRSGYDAGGTTNNGLHNALITAAIRDTGETMENFGVGTPGQLQAVLA